MPVYMDDIYLTCFSAPVQSSFHDVTVTPGMMRARRGGWVPIKRRAMKEALLAYYGGGLIPGLPWDDYMTPSWQSMWEEEERDRLSRLEEEERDRLTRLGAVLPHAPPRRVFRMYGAGGRRERG